MGSSSSLQTKIVTTSDGSGFNGQSTRDTPRNDHKKTPVVANAQKVDNEWVVIKTCTGKAKIQTDALKKFECDYFNRILWQDEQGQMLLPRDKQGRRKIRLDFDSEIFNRLMRGMRHNVMSLPPDLDEASIAEWDRQVDFLMHIPTLKGKEAAAAAAEKASKAKLSGFVEIKAGEFMMGSPLGEAGRNANEEQRRVELTRSFWCKAAPVTQGEWQALMGNNPSRFCEDGPSNERAADRPVEMVNFWDALAFCNKMSRDAGLAEYYDLSECMGIAGLNYRGPETIGVKQENEEGFYSYRLPSEAEQQRARRGSEPSTQNNATYAPPGTFLDEIAWHLGNSGSRPHPVNLRLPTNEGVFDGLGNVWEWCWDWYSASPPPPGIDGKLLDPKGPDSGLGRVCGGGSWANDSSSVRAARRRCEVPSRRDSNVGFRPVRFVLPATEPLDS